MLDRILSYFDRNGLFTEAHAATLLRHMLSAVLQCHTHNVVHRDIKLENFMVFQQGPCSIFSHSLSLSIVHAHMHAYGLLLIFLVSMEMISKTY